MAKQTTLSCSTQGQGLYEFTDKIESWVGQQNVDSGMCHFFVRHTSCSLTIQENADPSSKTDLENWLNRLVPENDPLYTHTMEGPDDMPAHIKASFIGSSVTIPITNGRLNLGTWQGVYLCEFRNRAAGRYLVATIYS